MNTRSNPPEQFFSKEDLPVRTRKEKKKSTEMAESNPERVASSESEEDEGSISDMPPPDQEPPKLPDLEVIRNRRSQSRTKSITKMQNEQKSRKIHTPPLVGLVRPNLKTHGETSEQIGHKENRDGKKSIGTKSLGYPG
jgi:hypothetical protein